MRIKFIRTLCTAREAYRRAHVYDVEDAQAQQFIKEGNAVAADAEPATQTAPPAQQQAPAETSSSPAPEANGETQKQETPQSATTGRSRRNQSQS